MAVISHRHRCLYIKAPKCASTSVLAWFLAHGSGRYTFRPSWYPGPLEHRIVSAARALALYPEYFTFTFLRDPHSRFLSIWRHANQLVEIGAPRQPRRYGSLGEFTQLCAELLDETRGLWGARAMAFRAEQAHRRYGPLGIELRRLYFLVCHARPQVDFLPGGDPPRLFGVRLPASAALSFAGSVEELDADFERLRGILGLSGPALPKRNVSAPETPRTLDAGVRRLVEELYAEDFALRQGAPAAAPGRAETSDRSPGPRVRLGRARLALAAAEIALEARILRCPRLRRTLAPVARWRRGLV